MRTPAVYLFTCRMRSARSLTVKNEKPRTSVPLQDRFCVVFNLAVPARRESGLVPETAHPTKAQRENDHTRQRNDTQPKKPQYLMSLICPDSVPASSEETLPTPHACRRAAAKAGALPPSPRCKSPPRKKSGPTRTSSRGGKRGSSQT